MIRGRARGGWWAAAATLLACLGLWGAARPAAAYVRYRTSSTNAVFAWPQACISITVFPLSMTDANGGMDMTTEQIMQAATESAAAWSREQNPCSYLSISVNQSAAPAHPDPTEVPIARYDYKNQVFFRPDSWCAPTDTPPDCSYDPSALAITSVFANKTNGQIRDADIEVNSFNFIWADLESTPASGGKQDLQNALTHEMGHLIGLDHTCYISGEPLIDQNGQPVPPCNAAPPDVAETTMFASAVPGDLGKRTLAPDDKQAVCDMYPVAKDPGTCGGSDGCSVAGGGGAEAPVVVASVLAGLGALVAATRRRARGR